MKEKVLVEKENLIEGFYKDLYIQDIIEEGVLNVCDLDRALFTHTKKDIKKYKDILSLFFRFENHDLDDFHFPEDKFSELYEKLIILVPQKNAKEENQHYNTASKYMKQKCRNFFIKSIFLEKKLITDDVEISMEGYEWNENFYTYTWHWDNVENLEYDFFRETGSGLYDLKTEELDRLVPRNDNRFEALELLRNLCIKALHNRKIMLIPGMESAVVLYKNIANTELIYKSDVDAVIAKVSSIIKFLQDEEVSKWLEKNNDYTLYVKSKGENNYTESAYIEAYHNFIGNLYGWEIFDEIEYDEYIDKYILPIELQFFKKDRLKYEPWKKIIEKRIEDRIVTYKENLDWKKSEINIEQENYETEMEECPC